VSAASGLREVFKKESPKLSLKGMLSDDRLKLFIAAAPGPEHASCSEQEILSLLADQVDTQQVERAVLADIVRLLRSNQAISEPRRIIKGHAAEQGQNGKLTLLAKPFSGRGEVRVDARGFATFSELHLFDSVAVGQEVAKLFPPRAGSAGLDALGKEIPAGVGTPIKVTLGKLLEFRPSPIDPEVQVVIAQGEGYLTHDSGRLELHDEFIVSGDVDYHVGSIDFIGKVSVRGNVCQGFVVKARKDIAVTGSFHGALLSSREGSVQVNGLVHGAAGGRIFASQNVLLTRAREILIEALQEVQIKQEAVNCKIRAGTVLRAAEARIFGGELLCVCGLEAKQLGSEDGVSTLVQLCSDVELRSDYLTLIASQREHQQAQALLELHLGPLAQGGSRLLALREPHKTRMQALLEKLGRVRESAASLEKRRLALLKDGRSSLNPQVNILGTLYPGVVLKVAQQVFAPTELLKGPCSVIFDMQNQKFVVDTLRGLQCSFPEAQPPTAQVKQNLDSTKT
jgi:uncharacterized protein (DUF342 family)